MKNAFATIGPVPVQYVAEVLQQVESQEWVVRFVAHSGMILINPGLSLQKPEPTPSFMVVACREYESGKEPKPPRINVGGRIL
jgi:hypothetical protein